MTARRPLLLLLTLAVLALVVFFRGRDSTDATPRPAESATIADDAAVSFPRLDTEKGIRQFEARVKEDPRDYLSMTILGQLYMRGGRDASDLGSFRKAEQMFHRALAANPRHAPAQALLASAYTSQHKFDEALKIVKPLYDASPGNIAALATLADIYIETGQYRDGEEAVKILESKAANVPAILARRAQVEELKGRTAAAVEMLDRAVAAMRRTADPGPDIAWFEARLGDVYFHSGCLAQSERHFDAALRLHDTYPIALAGLADVRAAQGRLPEAAGLYQRAIAESPQPRRIFALGAIEERLGRTADADRRYAEGEALARSPESAPAYYRDLSVFYAERLGKSAEALDLAQKDLAMRKDVKSYDVLAWALFRNRRYQEAAAAIGEALKLGTRDPDALYHAGMIYDALGQADKARTYLDEAARISPLRRAAQPDSAARTGASSCNLHS